MTVLPKRTSLKHYFILLTVIASVTLSIVFNLNSLRTMWKKNRPGRAEEPQNVIIYDI
jgi:hypothetical protein